MKSITLIISILLLVFITAACGPSASDVSDQVSAAEPAQEGGQEDIDPGDDPEADIESQEIGSDESQPASQTTQEPEFNREMPLAMTLALGTFELEQSGHPLDADQSAEMLTLWKAARSLSESDTTAVEELDSVVKQIQGVMTSEQLAEIGAMGLSFQDMGAVAEEMGIELGFGGGRFGDMTPEQQATMEAARESGEFPPGGFGGRPGGGPGGGPGGEGLSPEQRETARAERGGFQRVNLGLPGPMLDAVIEFLQDKVD